MAQITICDGCGGSCINHEKVGHVIKRDYCEGCMGRAEEYQAEIDKLHERVAVEWKEGLAEIRDTYSKALHALPDVAL